MKNLTRLNNRRHPHRNRKGGWLSFFAETTAQGCECSTSNLEGGFSLAMAKLGDRLRVRELSGGQGMRRHLTELGVIPGIELEVVSLKASGSVMVAIADRHVALGASVAHHILCTDEAIASGVCSAGKTRLREICIGCKGRVVGYQPTTRSYKRRLLSMGLTPGTEFIVTRHAPLGDPTEIKLRGFSLTLRKDEADALYIEEVQ